MQVSGIYRIVNIITGKMYIGQSLDVKNRIRVHRYQLKKGSHGNDHLLRSYNIHGASNFKYEILYTIENQTNTKEQIIQILNKNEEYFINGYDSFKNGYNLTSGGDNKIFSEESIAKMSASHIGQIPSLKCRQMTSERMKNRVVSDETKRRLSAALKGKRRFGAKNGFYGKKHTEESKQKMSESLKGLNVGENNTAYGKYGKDSPRYGKKHSEESKRKIGNAQLGTKNHNYGKTTPESVKQKCRNSYHGSRCHLAKLNNEQVIEIKKALLGGHTGVSLAKKYGVAATQISSIKNGKTWRHIQ